MYERYSNMQVAGPVDRTSSKVCLKLNISCKNMCVFKKIANTHNQYFNYLFIVYKNKSFHKRFGSFNCRFAFQYNPSLQPRALVVFGCISKRVAHGQIKQIIRILSKVPLLPPQYCWFPSCKANLAFF